jgi:uncharacterized lipoprotein YddW (UPF0748 family)
MQQIQSQVRAAQQRGLGVAFFYYESLWNTAPGALKERLAGFKSLFPYPALRTEVESGEGEINLTVTDKIPF